MNYTNVSSIAYTLNVAGFVSPYELKLPQKQLDDLVYDLVHFNRDKLFQGEYVLVHTFYGNVIIRST